MFAWLRDTLANTSPTLSYRHSMIPSPLFRQQQQQQKKTSNFSPSEDDDDEGTDDESNDNSFYHNPYHSSGQMNYNDVPQQQYANEHNYPTYLAQQQQRSVNTTNSSIDEQIYNKLLLLQQRGHKFQSHTHENQLLSTPYSLNVNNNITEEQLEQEEDEEEEEEEQNEQEEEVQKDNIDDYEIRAYYPGHYPNLDEQFDLASVVLWYKNVMQSVKKFM